ncbi:MAG: DNA polymerase III subunit beta [bacterium]
MKFTASRDEFLKGIQLVVGVVERKQTLPILSNILLKLDGASGLKLTGTDLEVEIQGNAAVSSPASDGETTIPGRKLLDITRALPEGSDVTLSVDGGKATLVSNKSRFTLSTLPANEFPNVEEGDARLEFSLPQAELKALIDDTAFAMAQQDVRYYLNGMLFEVSAGQVRAVATDGHRLAMATKKVEVQTSEDVRVILPRKGVLELSRLLDSSGPDARVIIGKNHFRLQTPEFGFTSKLVDGNYPDYQRVLPRGGSLVLKGDRETLKLAFSRAAILSNEKYRGVRLQVEPGQLKLVANNPEQEEAQEEVVVDYQGDSLEIGFNVSYVLDVLNCLSGSTVTFTLSDANSSALVEDPENSDAIYVVMPMRL